MTVLFISNSGAGFAGEVEVKARSTVGQLFKEQMKKGCKPEDHLIRVNRDIVAEKYVLREGDRVTITPTHIEGGKSLR